MRQENTEELLRESEERYRRLAELSPDAIAVQSGGKLAYLNAADLKLLGVTCLEEVLGKPILDFIHSDFHEAARARMRQIEEGMPTALIEQRWVRPDGRVVDVEVASAPITYLGRPSAQIVLRDVAECKASEEEMIKTGERFRSAFKNASTGAALLDLDNRYLLVNRAFCGMLGYPEEELLSKKSFEITHPEDLDASRRRTERLFSGEIEMMSLEKRYLCKDGQVVWAISDVSLMRDLEGKPDYFIAHYQDITERKRIEGELREAEARNRVMLDASPDLMFLVNRAGEFLDFEAQDDELYVPPEKIVGSRLRDVMPAEMADTALNHIGRALDSSEIQVFEYRLPAPEGPRDFEARLVVSGTDEVLAVVRDITERKKSEAALKESEESHRQQARELSLLHQVRTALAQELDLPVVFRLVVEAIADTYGYAQVSAYLLDNEELMLQHQVGYEHVIERVHISEGVMGRVARTGQSVLLKDVRDDPAFLGAIEGLVSEVCVPLFDEGGVVGTLNVESTDGIELTEDDLRLISALGEHVEIAIGRAQLYTQVRESEERFRSLVQNASDAISILDANSTIIYDSPAIERTLGYKPVERIGTRALDYVHPEDRAFAERTFSEVLNNPGVGLPIEYRLRHKDGSWRYFEAIRTNLLDDPAVGGVVLNYRDITERKQAEMRLEESEQRYKSLYAHNPDAVYSFDLEGNFVSANLACETLTDYTAEELMGRSFAPLVVPEDLERTLRHFEKAAKGEPQNYEIAINHKRGHRVELNVTNLPIVVAGEIVGVYGIAKDITERRRTEQAHARLAAIVQSSEDAIISRTRDGIITSWNKGAEKLYGYTAEEVIGRSGSFLYPPEHPQEMSEILEKIQRGESLDHHETVRMAKSGRRVCVSLSVSPIRDASGNAIGDSGIARDITEQKQAEEALSESEERYRAVIEQSAEAIWLFDPDTKLVLESNTSFQELLGYTAEELREMTNYDFVAHSREDIDALVQFKVLEGKSLPSERKYRRKDGTLLDVEVGGAMISYQSKRVVCSVARDLTERKALEERLTYQAFHDPLTELPNRALFLDRLQHALASAGRQISSIAVLYVDLDNFKIINDSLGHEMGDRVLVEAGRRLRSCLRPADTVARLGR
jgi:PAS domain S-box-containing protein